MTGSLPARIREWALSSPDQVAMRDKEFGLWEEITWADYWNTAELIAHALLSMGVETGDRVAIHSENRREWLFADVGIAAIRGVSVGIYPTNPAPEVLHVLRDSGTKIIIAEDQEQVDKAIEVFDELPELTTIVHIDPRGIEGRYEHPALMSWKDFLERGREHAAAAPNEVEERLAQIRPEDVTTLVYTSGTTGPPKGAMLSVDNVEFVIELLADGETLVRPPAGPHDVSVSYLPLCHVAERLFTVWLNAAVGIQVHFAESIETVQQALREVQPTLLFGVPRIWEKIVAGVHIRMSGASRLKKLNFALWMSVANWIGAKVVANRGKHTLATKTVYLIGWVFLYRALRERLGLSKVRYAASGAAPIAPEVLQFFMGIGLPMHEVYGMTENSALATANMAGNIILGTVGEPQPQTEIRIDEETGEILTRHRGNFLGYWNRPDATAEVLDTEGWLRTGDVGEWVEGTHVKITDRIKDIIITAGGKNISPSEIENSLKASPFIKEAIVIGDQRKFLTALIGIELDTVGNWAQERKMPFTTYRDLSEKPEVFELVRGIVDETNKKFASVETIKKFHLMGKELDHEEGELTATQKVKRSAITALFADEIEAMYSPQAVKA